MRRKLKNQWKDRNGAALIYVILALAIVMIFAGAIASLVRENLMQAKAQEDEIKAYYLSLSGSDLCFAALLQQGIGGEHDTLLYQQFSKDTHPALPSTKLTDTLHLDGGDVAIEVKALDRSGERWVQIKSTATLSSSSVTKTTTLQFQASNPLVQFKS